MRRYQYFFGLDKQKNKPFIDNKEQLLEAIEEHFMKDLKVDPVEVIYKFLATKKDQDIKAGIETRFGNNTVGARRGM